MQYFENTASKRGSRVDGFNPEYGAPCLPILSSLTEMMPQKDLWPINKPVWDYMDGGGFHKMTTDYKRAVDALGVSHSLAEYARKAQVVGAMNYRSIMEVWDYNKFDYGDRFASGFLFWYINSAQPQVASRLYDWSLEPTAALYYAKNALEPLHLQFDYLKNTVSIYNDYRQAFNDVEVVCDVYDLNAKRLSHHVKHVNIPPDGTINDLMTIEFPNQITPVHFIKLRLMNKKGREVASSFYWRSTDVYKGAWTMTGPAVGGFEALSRLRKATLNAKAQLKRNSRGQVVQVKLHNNSDALAFFTQLQLVHENGDPVKGAFYTDNFINLLPGERKEVSIELNKSASETGKLKVQISGLNMDLFSIKP